MSTTTVVSQHRVELKNYQYIDIVQTDISGNTTTTRGFKQPVETLILDQGVQKVVPEWVLENEYFKMLEADGVAQAL